MSNFDDLAMAVASFGGNNAVKFDDLGMPSIMVGIPKMKYSDIITGGTQETLPWWIVDGVEKEVIWVDQGNFDFDREKILVWMLEDLRERNIMAVRKKEKSWNL